MDLSISKIKNEVNLVSIEEALLYKNPSIVYKFMESYDVSYEDAEALLNETVKWLWLCAYKAKKIKETGKKIPGLFIDSSMVMIDEMWHTFILFTNDYLNFCNNTLGLFIHHRPTTKSEKDIMDIRLKEDKSSVISEVKEKNRFQYNFIYDALGDELGAKTLTLWYKTYADYYTRDKIFSLRKKT